MNLILRVLFLVLCLHESYGVIYYLNESEFERMPPLYKLDGYDSCLQKPSDVYCSLSFQLVADQPDELLHMIEEYSGSNTHFNHTKLRYGVCVTQSCQHYIHDKASVSKANLEGCLNQSFWREYKLKTRLQHYSCYNLSDNDVKVDISDVIAAVIVLTIIVINIFGSIYDVYTPSDHNDKHILLSFSIKRNWKKLMLKNKSESTLQNFKGLNGMKCIIAYGVILVHCMWPFVKITENIHVMELSYYVIPHYILYNGSILIQTFIVISGMLLSFKLELQSEKHTISWSSVPRLIFLRYVRLTPVYAFVIMLLATWLKFLGPGPVWEVTGNVVVSNCKKYWWLSLLYLNNYVYNYQCLLPYWYPAVDMQLYCFGLLVCVLLTNTKFRKTILMVLFVAGIVIVVVHTYIRDLHAHFLMFPSEASTEFESDPTFNEIYKTGHGNISSYVIGLSLGYFIHRCQQKKINFRKYPKLKYIYWSVLPLIFAVVLSGSVFYRDAPRDPLYIRVIYAALAKPVTGALVAVLIAGMVFKLENVYRKFLEWDLWVIPGKLTYCVFIIHFAYIIIYVNTRTSLIQLSLYSVLVNSACITIISYLTAVPLFLLVEAPFTEATKYLMGRPKKSTTDDYNDKSR